jgi:hypothetical protein
MRLLPAFLVSAAILAVPACKAGQLPPANTVATVAVNVVYKALDAAIDLYPADAGMGSDWSVAIDALETAEKVIRAGQDFCPQIPKLAVIADLVQCSECQAALTTATRELGCVK